jgi:hypothetical protein
MMTRARSIGLGLGAAGMLAACARTPVEVQAEGQALTLIPGEVASMTVTVCADRVKNWTEVDIVAEVTATRTDGAAEEAVVGVEVLDDGGYDTTFTTDDPVAEAAAFARLSGADSAVAAAHWDYSASGDWCAPYEIAVRVLDGPPETTVELEWTVSAVALDEPRVDVTITIDEP